MKRENVSAIVISIFACAFILAFFFLPLPGAPPSSAVQQQPAANPQSQTNPAPTIPAQQPNPKTGGQDASQDASQEARAWLTLIAVLSGAYFAWGAYIAARRQADTAEKTLTVVERAYLAVDDFEILTDAEGRWAIEGRPLVVLFKIHNTGRATAYLTSRAAEYGALAKLPDEPNYGASADSWFPIAGGRNINITYNDDPGGAQIIITQGLLADLEKRTRFIFLWAKFEYSDGISPVSRHLAFAVQLHFDAHNRGRFGEVGGRKYNHAD